MRIAELIKLNPDATLVNDVKLDWYPDDERNVGLARGFMFTHRAPQGYRSSLDLLRAIREAYDIGAGQDGNRLVAIAGYGRGKSHFALALANLFGQPLGSPEVTALLRSIAHVTDDATAGSYQSFRERRGQFLVVRLDGVNPKPLYAQFYDGLALAVRELTGDRSLMLPFWADRAGPALKRLLSREPEAVEAFLEASGTDTARLVEAIRTRDHSGYELFRQLYGHLHDGVLPDLGGLTSISDGVRWAVETYCRGDHPRAGGMLVLLDELSAFVRGYARNRTGTNELQDLLNGVDTHRGRVLLLALAQHDPNLVARSVLKDDIGLASVEKELDRLPRQRRYMLYSSFETVLDAYLVPNDQGAWRRFVVQHDAAFDYATETTLKMTAPCYDETAGWGPTKFRSTVTEGCFPLHPLTTALFCHLEVGEALTARSVLGHLKQELEARSEEPAERHGQPNWIWATSLVDWFGKLLEPEGFRSYESATNRVGPEAPNVQRDMLKALLLFSVAKLKCSDMRFATVVSCLSGYSERECEAALKGLYSSSAIEYDKARGIYRLWPPGVDPTLLERDLANAASGRTLDVALVGEKNRAWQGDRLGPLEMQVPCGNPQDWACRRMLATRETLTPEWLRCNAAGTAIGVEVRAGVPLRVLREGVRGVVVGLIARSQDDLDRVSSSAQELLDQAVGDTAIPVALQIPRMPQPELVQAIIEEQALADLASKKTTYGDGVYRAAVDRRKDTIERSLKSLDEQGVLVVSRSMRAHGLPRRDQSARAMMNEAYGLAYSGWPTFFTTYRDTSSHLGKAVKAVSHALLTNAVRERTPVLQQDSVSKDLCAKFIRRGASPQTWGVVDHADEITEPTHPGVRKAWKHLDQVFGPGSDNVRAEDGLIPLLSPPFGYDYNTAMLLFSAWFGRHRRDLQAESNKGARVDLGRGDFDPQQAKTAKAWIRNVCCVREVRLSRRDPAEEEREARELINRIREHRFRCSIEEAKKHIETLRAFADNEDNEPELRQEAKRGADGLKRDLEDATGYADRQVAIRASVSADQPKISGLCEADASIGDLPTLRRVREANWPSPDVLRDEVKKALEEAVSHWCEAWSRLKALEDYGLQRRQLQDLQKRMEGIPRVDLADDVKRALTKLGEAKAELERETKDAGMAAQAGAMRQDAPLARLRADVVKLDAMRPASEHTRDVVAAKRDALQSAIKDAASWADELSAQVDAADTPEALDSIRDDILRREGVYADCVEKVKVDEAIARCKRIRAVLVSARGLAARKPADRDEADATVQGLRSLLDDRADSLSRQHRSAVEAAQAAFRETLARLESEAVAWLDGMEKRADADPDPGALLGACPSNPCGAWC